MCVSVCPFRCERIYDLFLPIVFFFSAGNARKDIYGYHYKFGKATLFVTTNPDDKNSLLVHFLCGGDFGDPDPPPLIVRNVRLAQYPGALALSHERFLEVFIALVLGWDTKNKRPFERGGVFGHCKAYMGPNEEQARLSLHTHLLVWIYGHDRLLERMRNQDARAELEKFIEDCISANIPWPTSTASSSSSISVRCSAHMPRAGLRRKSATGHGGCG